VHVTCALAPERALWAVGDPQGLAHGLMAEPSPDPADSVRMMFGPMARGGLMTFV
jgi:hypothetical protein